MTQFPTPRKSRAVLKSIALAVAVVASWGAASVQANTLTFLPNSPGSVAPKLGDGNYATTETLQFGSKAAASATAGALSVIDNSAPSSIFWVYCLDPMVGVNNFGTTSYTPVGLSPYLNSSAYFGNIAYADPSLTNPTTGAQDKYVKQLTAPVLANLTELYSHAYYDSLTSATKSAAFQYAIWEVMGETPGNYSTSAGGLKIDGSNADPAFKTQTDQYLTALTAPVESTGWTSIGLGAGKAFTYTVYQPDNMGVDGSQAVMRVTETTPGQIPEPAPGWLLIMGGLALAASRRATRRKQGE